MIVLYQPFQSRTIPRPALNLPPLSKGGGLTASHKLSLCCVLLATRPPFYSLNFSAVKTEGLLYHPSLSTTSLPPLVKGEVLSPEKIRATAGGIAFLPYPFRFSDTSVNNPSIVGSASHCNRSSPLHEGAKGDGALPTLPKPHYPTKIANTLALLAPPVAPNTALAQDDN